MKTWRQAVMVIVLLCAACSGTDEEHGKDETMLCFLYCIDDTQCPEGQVCRAESCAFPTSDHAPDAGPSPSPDAGEGRFVRR